MAVIDENTVSAKGQLKPTEFVSFEGIEKDGLRIMFVGNSITRHGVLERIGWFWDWGMAASSKEKDYVHQVISKVRETQPESVFCICQVADWERKYVEGNYDFSVFESARNFNADIIVMRLIENCPKVEDGNFEPFIKAYGELVSYLNPENKAKILITTGFWKHTCDDGIREYARREDLDLVELGDLGELDEMKAIGLFEHHGVSIHPGDLGMQHIADRIYDGIQKWL